MNRLICLFAGHDWDWHRVITGDLMELWFRCDRCGLETTKYREKPTEEVAEAHRTIRGLRKTVSRMAKELGYERTA